MSDRRRQDEEPAGISDYKRTLAISGDKRASVKANAIREEGGGEGTKCVDRKSGTEGKGHCWQGSDVLHHNRSFISQVGIKQSEIISRGWIYHQILEAAALLPHVILRREGRRAESMFLQLAGSSPPSSAHRCL